MLTAKMKSPPFYYQFLLFLFFLSYAVDGGTKVADGNTDIYIVYMGAASSSQASVQQDYHTQLLASVLKKDETMETSIIHSYKHGFSGFAARLTSAEARTMAQKPGVISVFVDPMLELYTTRSWDFLHNLANLETDSTLGSASVVDGSDTIIGVFDTGIWPESESFRDTDMGPIPSRWKGVCMETKDFDTSNCNRKLIGARYYNNTSDSVDELTPRDIDGHGTHAASIAAGTAVANASYYGLAVGTAKGGSPGSRIAIYKVCTSIGCPGSAMLAAFDDAIHDGVDIISVSLGRTDQTFETNPIAIGAFHAMEKGIMVVCGAGNGGPFPSTVVNYAPWIFTVAATTTDRDFESDFVFGANKVIKGKGINFSTLQKSPIYPLIYGLSAKTDSSRNMEARNCNPGSLEGAKIKGKIVLCEQDYGSYPREDTLVELKEKGVVGVVFVHSLELERVTPFVSSYPMAIVSYDGAPDILNYIKSTRNPVATILPTISVNTYKPAPVVAYFSSRGPAPTKNILKPDITAPGVSILAAWTGINYTSEVPGQKASQFKFESGTSMACPHVSGIAATIKSKYPTWSPSAIKSAIMTTASQLNNEGATITTDLGPEEGTPYDFGAGELSPSRALEPGLVYETNTEDYLFFLCNYGYNVSTIKKIASVIPDGFDCPEDSSTDLISNLNYPSIAISKLNKKERNKVVSRVVTNVGPDEETTYVASIQTPSGLDVKVMPNKLQFTKGSKKLRYQMIFSLAPSSRLKGVAFGSITWTNGKYKVRSPFVVSSN